jgi:hypothetical protein
MMFLLTSWRPGRSGALRMGMEHGGWCVGCCWGLMAALFALGVMSIGWMVLIAALIATEKLLPWKAVANRSVALLLIVLGLGVAFASQDVPGLTLPDSPEAQAAMDSMGMGAGSSDGGSMSDDAMNAPSTGGMGGDANGGMGGDKTGGMPDSATGGSMGAMPGK